MFVLVVTSCPCFRGLSLHVRSSLVKVLVLKRPIWGFLKSYCRIRSTSRNEVGGRKSIFTVAVSENSMKTGAKFNTDQGKKFNFFRENACHQHQLRTKKHRLPRIGNRHTETARDFFSLCRICRPLLRSGKPDWNVSQKQHRLQNTVLRNIYDPQSTGPKALRRAQWVHYQVR